MRNILTLSLLFSLSACSSDAPPTESSSQKSVAITGLCFSGTAYTARDDVPKVSGIATLGDTITFVGDTDTNENWCGEHAGANPKMINLGSQALFPGFTDAHSHLVGIGFREMTLNLEGSASIEELKTRLAETVANTPSGDTIYGRGWIETHWPEDRFPNRYDLDEVSPDNPVILERADGHAVVVNTAAINAAGITSETEAPFGGDILKSGDGEPNGMLIDRADGLVKPLMNAPSRAQKLEAFERGAKIYAQRGWTNTHSMSVDPDNVILMKEVHNNGNLPIRVYNSIDISNGFELSRFDDRPAGSIETRAVKLYSDGALGSRGAALLEPYADDDDNVGLMLTTYETIMPVLEKALRNGVQINTHAIGDKANKLVLDWYEEAFATVPESERAVADPRWRIEHSQIIALEDIQRFADLGVIPSMQPSHAIGDLHFAVDRLGPERLAGGYAWRKLIDSGSIIAGGSDAPVEVGDPRIEFYAAVARKDLKGYNNENWYEGEKVSRQEALKMFTIWPAYAAFQEEKLGTLEVGKKADFTIFDQNIMTIPEPNILTTDVAMTVVDGDIVYER